MFADKMKVRGGVEEDLPVRFCAEGGKVIDMVRSKDIMGEIDLEGMRGGEVVGRV